MRPYLEQELTQEKEAFDTSEGNCIKPLQDKTWQLAETNSKSTLYPMKILRWLIIFKISLIM